MRGISIPGHRDFEEVNLRFYVRRRLSPGRTVAPSSSSASWCQVAIAAIARLLYNEPYLSVPMHHRVTLDGIGAARLSMAGATAARSSQLVASVEGSAQPLEAGSEAEFITEHYWGYTRQRDGGTLEYEVEHPRWRVWTTPRVDLQRAGGRSSTDRCSERSSARPPRSAFVAEGSPVTVYAGQPDRVRTVSLAATRISTERVDHGTRMIWITGRGSRGLRSHGTRITRITDHGTRITRITDHGTRIARIATRDADHADRHRDAGHRRRGLHRFG